MKQLINQDIIKHILIGMLVLNLGGCATSSRSERQSEQVPMDLIQENESNREKRRFAQDTSEAYSPATCEPESLPHIVTEAQYRQPPELIPMPAGDNYIKQHYRESAIQL